MICIKNLTTKDEKIFQELNVKFDSKINFLVGKNGSGKSTLVNLLAGIIKPKKGTILIDSNKVSYKDGAYRKFIGFYLNINDYILNLKANEYIQIIENIWNIKDDMLIEYYYNFFDLNDSKKKFIYELSSGFLQRIKLMTVLIKKTKYLILDEPFNSLDLEFKNTLLSHIKELISIEEKQLLLTSHNEQVVNFFKDDCQFFEIQNKKISLINYNQINSLYK